MRITDRDKKIFNILFRLRYMTISQLSLYLKSPIKSIYNRVELFINSGYLESEWITKNKLYKNGIEIRRLHERDSYKRKVNILKYTLNHHLTINDIYIFG